MPWLRLIFDAFEDYRKQRELAEAERETLEAHEREAMKVFEDVEANGDESDQTVMARRAIARTRKRRRKTTKDTSTRTRSNRPETTTAAPLQVRLR
jgi:hypothetical protein